MSISVFAFRPEHSEAWDEFCLASVNATFLHSRRFLSYHGDRFEDLSLLVFEGARLLALLPAARSPADSSLVVSHPGSTYGGFIHDGQLLGMRSVDALGAVMRYYRDLGLTRIIYKVIPYIYSRVPAQDDLYALFRLGARRVRCDLASAIDLQARLPITQRRRRALRKAKSFIKLSSDPKYFDAFWAVLEDNLARKHGARPVHDMAEIGELMRRFPGEIVLRSALAEGVVVGGVVLFLTKRVWHAQYIASNESGYELSALDAVFDSAIAEADAVGARYFDFGSSNEEDGTILNSGLYSFKSEFGGGGVSHEFYELDLRKTET